MWNTKKELPYGMWDTKKELPYGMWDTKKGITLWNLGHKKRVLTYGSELYKVGEKIVV